MRCTFTLGLMTTVLGYIHIWDLLRKRRMTHTLSESVLFFCGNSSLPLPLYKDYIDASRRLTCE